MKEIYKSLAAFQRECPTIKKNAKGYGYKYSDLTEVKKTIDPYLYKHGLGYTQLLEGDSLKTIVFHSRTAEEIVSTVNIPNDVTLKGQNAFQILGSAISYLRRYSLVCALGLVTDEDTDTRNIKTEAKKPAFTEANFQAAKKVNATIEAIKKRYTITKEIQNKYLEYGAIK